MDGQCQPLMRIAQQGPCSEQQPRLVLRWVSGLQPARSACKGVDVRACTLILEGAWCILATPVCLLETGVRCTDAPVCLQQALDLVTGADLLY